MLLTISSHPWHKAQGKREDHYLFLGADKHNCGPRIAVEAARHTSDMLRITPDASRGGLPQPFARWSPYEEINLDCNTKQKRHENTIKGLTQITSCTGKRFKTHLDCLGVHSRGRGKEWQLHPSTMRINMEHCRSAS